MANVDHVHDALIAKKDDYELIDDVLGGETSVKKAGVKYLPMPNAADTSAENIARYYAYKTRAVFYNVTSRTLRGLVGQVFVREPVIEVPTLLDVVKKDADGSGTTLDQLAEAGVFAVLSKGRAGLLADFPTTEGETVTRSQQLSGDVRPTLTLYDANSVINWRTITRGSKSLLSLVVIKERYAKDDDGFAEELEDQFRVLKLDASGTYVVELWRMPEQGGDFRPVDTFTPLDGQGKPLEEIPFRFIGVFDNTPSVDPAPLLDMAQLNMAHYRNSADYEESVFLVGQPTVVLAGLTEEWVKNILGGRVEFGSRAALSLPVGGSAEILSVEPNTLAFGAMEHKEKQMVALGAKLVENTSVQRTATEATQNKATEDSTLASAAKNVAEAFKWCLEWCAIFAGVTSVRRDASDDDTVKFELNTDFAIANMSPAERQQLMQEWQNGGITFSEYRAAMRRTGIATLDDAAARAEIAEDIQNAPKLDLEDDPAGDDTQTGGAA